MHLRPIKPQKLSSGDKIRAKNGISEWTQRSGSQLILLLLSNVASRHRSGIFSLLINWLVALRGAAGVDCSHGGSGGGTRVLQNDVLFSYLVLWSKKSASIAFTPCTIYKVPRPAWGKRFCCSCSDGQLAKKMLGTLSVANWTEILLTRWLSMCLCQILSVDANEEWTTRTRSSLISNITLPCSSHKFHTVDLRSEFYGLGIYWHFILEVQLIALMTGLVIKLLMEYFFTISEYLMYCVNIMATRIRVNCRLLRSAGNILSENILIALRALHTFQA